MTSKKPLQYNRYNLIDCMSLIYKELFMTLKLFKKRIAGEKNGKAYDFYKLFLSLQVNPGTRFLIPIKLDTNNYSIYDTILSIVEELKD